MSDQDNSSNLSEQGLTALERLEKIIIASHVNVREAEGSALEPAMRGGDALIQVKNRKLIRHNKWEDYCRETCGSERTAQVYMQLARHRSMLEEAKAQSSALLTIHEALTLIRKAKGTGKPKGSSIGRKDHSASASRSFDGWTDDEIRNALASLGYTHFRKVIPVRFRQLLEAHAGAQMLRRERERHPKLRLKDIDALRLVVDNTDTDVPPTQH